jgi:hypothetical protein
MNLALAERIANAVLYEGYILYPYRPSAVKNRQRWTFGGIYPQTYSQAQGGTDACSTQTECLVAGDGRTMLDVRIRFLHLQGRTVGELEHPLPDVAEAMQASFRPVEALKVGDKVFRSWQESVEREVNALNLALRDLTTEPQRLHFAFPSSREMEPLPNAAGEIVGVLVRQQEAIEGAVEVVAEQVSGGLFKVTVQMMNLTAFEDAAQQPRDEALLRSFVSTHAILSLHNGGFISLLDPPEEYQETAALCRNLGTYPVLVGAEGECDMMLASPIILYDYPQIAPESAGDLFDGTEIDEILTLRILTLTDEEKQEARQSDERARELLDRTEALPWEQLMKLHGVMRGIRPLEEP